MCGLSGVAGSAFTREESAFKSLLIFSQIRGQDSTGIGSVSRNKILDQHEMKIAKETGPPYFLFDTKSFDKCFYGTNQMYLGHNRSKTIGDITRKNAHPFLFEDVLGAHNGTIDWQNKNRLEKGAEFKTDSEAIFHNIQVHGIEDTVSRIEKTEPYALVWYDRRDNTVNFLRNEHRPFWYIYANDRRTLFWASEYEILMAAIVREPGLKPADKAFVTTPDQHYKWVIPDKEAEQFTEPTRNRYENHKVEHYSFWKNEDKNKNSNKSVSIYNSETHTWEYPDDKDGKLPAITSIQPSKLDALQTNINLARERAAQKASVSSPGDFIRKQKLTRLQTQGLIEGSNQKFPVVYENSSIVAHMDKTSGQWIIVRWNDIRMEWEKFLSYKPPLDIPYHILDIEARHNFKHEGKGKHKKIFYKGFKGTLLNQDQFNKVMQNGCLSCDRKPEWGNEVIFVDNTNTFICEYCSMTPDLVDSLKQTRRAVG